MAPLLVALALALLPAAPPTEGIAWFAGGFDEALAAAAELERPLLVEFCDRGPGYCEKLERQTFSHPPVVELSRRYVCLRVDAGTEPGRALGKSYHVSTLPTVLFLEPDGAPRDVLRGFAPPEAFADELARVLSGEGTIPALRARIAADEGDLDARYELARKLSKVGDAAGIAEQVAAIERLDPEGRSRASRRLALDRAAQAVQRMQPPSDARFRELLEDESEPDILYLGWQWVHRIDRRLAAAAPDEAERARLTRLAREAAALAWPHCPTIERPLFGNEIAWWMYEERAALDAGEKRFALDVAREAVQLQPADANLRDTLASCLHMNGRAEEALAEWRRCVALEPENPEWPARLAAHAGG